MTCNDAEISRTGAIAASNIDHDVLVSNDNGVQWNFMGINNITISHGLTFSPNGEELAFGNKKYWYLKMMHRSMMLG